MIWLSFTVKKYKAFIPVKPRDFKDYIGGIYTIGWEILLIHLTNEHKILDRPEYIFDNPITINS
ncbi:hypothetical protein CFB3_11410 [Clostridium folliculivorans]|uniref:Uncharacterized protein n=1 Tax=Clostridium folliculivorans TaxID=2886038 RepID=A0A9W5Y4K1_9CLOT|nr:hypothetical protein CFOLD11_33600 [Clostridium folliculivorans]GKU29035.1 hypothetical protein CFB3_11410 [Clostridium folliculivorans]